MCGKRIKEFVSRGHSYVEVEVACGSTSPSGYPWLCPECEEKHAGRDWRREAEEAGEQWDDDY
jgi:hypothetical protein